MGEQEIDFLEVLPLIFFFFLVLGEKMLVEYVEIKWFSSSV